MADSGADGSDLSGSKDGSVTGFEDINKYSQVIFLVTISFYLLGKVKMLL